LVWRPGFNSLNPRREEPEKKRRTPFSEKGVRPLFLERALASLGIVAGVVLVRVPSLIEGHALLPVWIVIVVAAIAGTPLFAILGGTAALLFMHDGVTPATILVEPYSLTVSPTLPPIPL